MCWKKIPETMPMKVTNIYIILKQSYKLIFDIRVLKRDKHSSFSARIIIQTKP